MLTSVAIDKVQYYLLQVQLTKYLKLECEKRLEVDNTKDKLGMIWSSDYRSLDKELQMVRPLEFTLSTKSLNYTVKQ